MNRHRLLHARAQESTGVNVSWIKDDLIKEQWMGKMIWSGRVSTFELIDHPETDTAFAWTEDDPATGKERTFVVLKQGPIQTARDAVRASIARDYEELERARRDDSSQSGA